MRSRNREDVPFLLLSWFFLFEEVRRRSGAHLVRDRRSGPQVHQARVFRSQLRRMMWWIGSEQLRSLFFGSHHFHQRIVPHVVTVEWVGGGVRRPVRGRRWVVVRERSREQPRPVEYRGRWLHHVRSRSEVRVVPGIRRPHQ